MANPKKILTIAGSDTSGGAGIQADLKTFQERDTYGMSAITVIVAMDPDNNWNHLIFPVELETIKAQIKTVTKGIGIDAVKTGMLPTAEIIELAGKSIKELNIKNVVVDPVMVCKGANQPLFPENTVAMQKYLMPFATITTPNLFEAAQLANMDELKNIDDMKTAAKNILKLGAKNVVIKGGKSLQGKNAIDLFYDGKDFVVLENPKIDTTWNHGAGCSFAACITAELAKGASVLDAVKTAKSFVAEGLKESFVLNRWVGPIYHKALSKK